MSDGSKTRCAAVFRYEVPEHQLADFEAAYGPDGDWAKLYRRADGYLGTSLWRDPRLPGTYLLVDRWASADHRKAALKTLAEPYGEHERRLRPLYRHESFLGELLSVGEPA